MSQRVASRYKLIHYALIRSEQEKGPEAFLHKADRNVDHVHSRVRDLIPPH